MKKKFGPYIIYILYIHTTTDHLTPCCALRRWGKYKKQNKPEEAEIELISKVSLTKGSQSSKKTSLKSLADHSMHTLSIKCICQGGYLAISG